MDFKNITKILIPLKCINKAYDFMKYAGEQKLEGVALFVGNKEERNFYIKDAIIPKQKACSSQDGLLYLVDAEELHQINLWLYENKYNVIAQIHSHPKEAYHSKTDDLFPIVTTLGGLSIVVPNFASGTIDINSWVFYRLISKEIWEELDAVEVKQLLEVI
jgi:hypothetical protein